MSVNYIDKSTGDLIRVAGQGKAEYGASTVRKRTIFGWLFYNEYQSMIK